MNEFVRPGIEGRVRPIVGCPVHGPDKDKIVGRVLSRHTNESALIRRDDDTVIPIQLIVEVPPSECTCHQALWCPNCQWITTGKGNVKCEKCDRPKVGDNIQIIK
jgi:hypothetical protein